MINGGSDTLGGYAASTEQAPRIQVAARTVRLVSTTHQSAQLDGAAKEVNYHSIP
jgi:hypothetical protein